MTRPLLAVLDYGIGNLHSAQKSLEHEGADARLTADPALIADADGVVLPGVGAFGACMNALRAAGLEGPTHDAVASGRPFLGICVGMQMLFTKSQENEDAAGLDVIPGTVTWIPAGPKIPQMQWNRLDIVDPAEPMGSLVAELHSRHRASRVDDELRDEHGARTGERHHFGFWIGPVAQTGIECICDVLDVAGIIA